MTNMVIEGRFNTGLAAFDIGITDLMVMEQNGQTVLYASSGQNGGLSAFDLDPNGVVSVLDTALFSNVWADGALRDMSLMEVNGALNIAVAGSGEDQLRVYDLNADGSIGSEQQLTGLANTIAQLVEVDQTNATTLFMADMGSDIVRGFSIAENGTLSQDSAVSDTNETYGADVMAISSTRVMQDDYVISVSQTERGVSVYRMDGKTLVNTGNAGVHEGLGIMTPTDMQVVEIGGRSFILLASAPSDGVGQSGAITVIEVAQDGSLVDTDHVIDTGETQFGDVQSLEVVEADGRTYVVAGGGDDGVTLFVLMPHGRLQLLGNVEGDPGLENIASMALHHNDGELRLFVASEVETGVTEISADVSNHGQMMEVDHSGGVINGTARDDVIIGGAGNDSIQGDAGDDILEDGLGVDTLHGGDGADLFVLRSDFSHDQILDFQAGFDQLDLSSWPMLYDTSQIGYTATAHGAILDWRGETLELFSRDGQTLSFSQVQAAILKTADRVPDFSLFGGNEGAQELNGTAINDAFNAGAGKDTVNGFAGDDYIDGAVGDDVLFGGQGNDTLILGAGNDYAEGGDQNDWIVGGGGDDEIWAGNNNDTIYGDGGSDLIRGQRGNDLIYGGDARDIILGDNNEDTIYGEGGNDVLRGGNGLDFVDGGNGNDRVFGANDEDTLYGGIGNDLIRAGYQSDYVNGGAGNDYLVGGGGFDELVGGNGNDTMEGNFNADRFFFEDGHGDDVIVDFNATSNAEKLVFTDLSTMNSYGDVIANSIQQGADVFIDTGNGNSILLQDVEIADLHAEDFLF